MGNKILYLTAVQGDAETNTESLGKEYGKPFTEELLPDSSTKEYEALDRKFMMLNKRVVVAVVAIDFGTTYSGFAYAHKANPDEITAHNDWKLYSGHYKTPTVLKYDDKLNLLSWGLPALAERPNKKKNKSVGTNLAEKFKLHLGKMENKSPLPRGLNYKTAISHYLKEMGNLIKETLRTHWPDLDFFQQVLIIMTVPNEYGHEAVEVMRECAYKAMLINSRNSKKLKFMTEAEAAAIHCMKKLKEHNIEVGSTFMIVDCGGGTVDLTTHRLLDDDKLDETVVRKGDSCGGSFVDEEFLSFIGQKIGNSALEEFRKDHYSQLQYLVQEFCRCVKIPFTGKKLDYTTPVEFHLKELCPAIEKYIKGNEFENMEKEEWIVELEFEDVKAIFDPVVERIIELIREQLEASESVSMMMLVGGFSESKYLQNRIRQEFRRKLDNKISVPTQPITAIEKGAVQFGLKEEIVNRRVLRWTYGVEVLREWTNRDPKNRRLPDGRIAYFDQLAKCGDQIPVGYKVQKNYFPTDNYQNSSHLNLYITENDNVKFCNEPGVKLLYSWKLPVFNDILFTLTFGSVEIEATAKNKETGVVYKTTVHLDI